MEDTKQREKLKCETCGGDQFQMVEKAEIWYPLQEVAEDGTFIFDASQRTVSDEGEAIQIECRTCTTSIGLPEYDWR